MKECPSTRTAVLITGVWLTMTMDACAYLDPGSGSYLFQILIAALTAMVFFFATLKQKIMAFARSIFGKPNPNSEANRVESSDSASVDSPQ